MGVLQRGIRICETIPTKADVRQCGEGKFKSESGRAEFLVELDYQGKLQYGTGLEDLSRGGASTGSYGVTRT